MVSWLQPVLNSRIFANGHIFNNFPFMKRSIQLFLALILVSGAFFFISCKEKVATTGSLSVTAMTKDGVLSGATQLPIFLATSKANLDNKVYERSGWLDANGSIIFRELQPKLYWYKVEGWEDIGGSQVYNGIDESVILWLNTPSIK